MDLIKELLNNLQQPIFQVKSEEHVRLAKEMEQSMKSVLFIYVYFGLQSYISFSAIPFLSPEKTTLTDGWFPFDWTVSPYYELVYVFQNFVTVLNILICLNMDTFTFGLLMFIGLQCDFLCCVLNSMGDLESADENVEELETSGRRCVVKEKDTKLFSREMLKKLIVCIEHYAEIKR